MENPVRVLHSPVRASQFTRIATCPDVPKGSGDLIYCGILASIFSPAGLSAVFLAYYCGINFYYLKFIFDTLLNGIYTLKCMGITEIIGDKKALILVLADKYGASNIRVFGSVANGTANQNSDIDFLVEWRKTAVFLI